MNGSRISATTNIAVIMLIFVKVVCHIYMPFTHIFKTHFHHHKLFFFYHFDIYVHIKTLKYQKQNKIPVALNNDYMATSGVMIEHCWWNTARVANNRFPWQTIYYLISYTLLHGLDTQSTWRKLSSPYRFSPFIFVRDQSIAVLWRHANTYCRVI